MSEENIAVIMSTYNGEKYLSEQIDSILNQKEVNVTLIIRDDGSLDSTRDILKDYANKFENIKIIYGQNVGFAKSFLIALKNAKGFDYYAFSDQDDYWENDKIFRAVELIRDSNKEFCLYYSNLNVSDKNLNVFRKTQLEKRKKTIESVTLRRSIAGCTMVFNNRLKKMIEKIDELNITDGISHDSILMSLAYSLNANIICDTEAKIKYRQHNSNVSGSSKGISGRIKKEVGFIRKLKYNESNLAELLLNVYDTELKKSERKVLGIIKSSRYKISSRMRIFFSPNFATGNILLTIYGKFRGLIGVL